MDTIRNYRISLEYQKISNQISRILLRLINRTEVIVKAASRKPKKLVIVSIKKLNEIFSFFIHTYVYKAFP